MSHNTKVVPIVAVHSDGRVTFDYDNHQEVRSRPGVISVSTHETMAEAEAVAKALRYHADKRQQ